MGRRGNPLEDDLAQGAWRPSPVAGRRMTSAGRAASILSASAQAHRTIWRFGALHISSYSYLSRAGHGTHDPFIPPLEGDPDQIIEDDQMVAFFGLDPKRKRADKAAHFGGCNWVLVEAKTK